MTVHSTVTPRVNPKDMGEVTGQSRASRMSTKWRSPTKVHSPRQCANRDTPAPTAKGSTTSTLMATAAGRTHR